MGSLMEIRRRMMETDALPPKYQRVEYVIGNATGSNFDTGVAGDNDNLRLVFCAEINVMSNYHPFCGNYVGETTDCWRVITATNERTIYATRGRIANNSAVLYTGTVSSSFLNKKMIFDISRKRATVSIGEWEYVKEEATASHGTANNTNIDIGYNRVASGGTGTVRKKYYYFRIYDDTKLIRNYIPCYRKSDNKAGFYDLVNHTFNPSIGASDFIIPS